MGMTIQYEEPTGAIYRHAYVSLNKATNELYSVDGVPDSIAVVRIIASGLELGVILQKFEGLPYAKDVEEMTWRGDFARFIMDHLIIRRYPK